MLRYLNFLTLLFLISFFITTQTVLAGDNIPSVKEVEYASVLYKLMNTFDKNESQFSENLKTIEVKNQNAIINEFRKKYDYSKMYYLETRKLIPTSKFAKSHQDLLVNIYETVKCTKAMLDELEKGRGVQQVHAEYTREFQQINTKYTVAVKEFLNIIKSWQKQYIEKVIPTVPASNSGG